MNDFQEKWNKKWHEFNLLERPLYDARFPRVRLYSLASGDRPNSREDAALVNTFCTGVIKTLGADQIYLIRREFGGDSELQHNSEKTNNKHVWQTIALHDEDDPTLHLRIIVSRHVLPSTEVEESLTEVAQDKLSGVLITPNTLEWLFYVYDAGIDIYGEPELIDFVRVKYKDRVSKRSDGL
jgi:hypothetical protein